MNNLQQPLLLALLIVDFLLKLAATLRVGCIHTRSEKAQAQAAG